MNKNFELFALHDIEQGDQVIIKDGLIMSISKSEFICRKHKWFSDNHNCLECFKEMEILNAK